MFMRPATEMVIIGIGANLGNPRDMIDAALAELSRLAVGEMTCSSVWRSEAFGLEGNDFANAVVSFACSLAPQSLLRELQIIEEKHGRDRDHGHHTSRTLDLDIIAYGDLRAVEPGLTIPHPEAFSRRFVLLPLQEIDPGYVFVDRDENLEQLIARADEIRIEKWDP